MSPARVWSGRRLLPAVVAAAPLVAMACAGRAVFVPPTGSGRPAPDAVVAWAEASGVCRSLSSYRAELGLTGQVGQQRIRGLASARLNAAITRAGQIGLEATVSGGLLFLLAGTAQASTLLLRDPNRVVTAPPEDILDALVGVRLGPDRLLPILGGCASGDAAVVRAADHGAVLEIVTNDAALFLERASGRWRVRAGRFDGVQVDYHAFGETLPREIDIRSTRAGGPVVRLQLSIRESLLNGEVPPAAFRLTVPPDAVAISLEELRDSGPLVDGRALP